MNQEMNPAPTDGSPTDAQAPILAPPEPQPVAVSPNRPVAAVKPKPKRLRLKAVETLGLSPRRWSQLAQKAVEEYGEFMDRKITARVLLVGGFDSIDQVEYAMKEARKMLDDPQNTQEQRTQILGMIALIGKSWKDMAGTLMDLSEVNAPELEDKPKRPANLPPSIPLQINFNGGNPQSVRSSANSGQGQPVIDVNS